MNTTHHPESGSHPTADGSAPEDEQRGDAVDGAPGEPAHEPELDAHEGADAFETDSSARRGTREAGTERQDEDIISLDTPD